MTTRNNLRHTVSVMLIAAASALLACGQDGSLGDQPTLSGQLRDWNRGGGYTLEVRVSIVGPVLASAPIDASGNFSITLPGSSVVTPLLKQQHITSAQSYLGSGCTGDYQLDPLDFADATLQLAAVSGTSKLGVNHFWYDSIVGPTKMAIIIYTFLDREVTESGTGDCQGATLTYDVHFKPGWNRELIDTSISASGQTVLYYTGGEPSGSIWFTN